MRGSLTAGTALLHKCVGNVQRETSTVGSWERLSHGGMRRHALTHTVMCMMWTLARARPRVKNKPDLHKQTVAMATTNHVALRLTNVPGSFAKFLQQTTLHLPTLVISTYVCIRLATVGIKTVMALTTHTYTHTWKTIYCNGKKSSVPAACQRDSKLKWKEGRVVVF